MQATTDLDRTPLGAAANDPLWQQEPALLPLALAAADVRLRAYAPYSGFLVGAALQSTTGTVLCGCNVENASYPVGQCAERSAIGIAVSQGLRQFDVVVIVTDAPEPAAPCGLCRQTLAEFGLHLRVVLVSLQGKVWQAPLHDLLPHAFGPGSFEVKRIKD